MCPFLNVLVCVCVGGGLLKWYQNIVIKRANENMNHELQKLVEAEKSSKGSQLYSSILTLLILVPFISDMVTES